MEKIAETKAPMLDEATLKRIRMTAEEWDAKRAMMQERDKGSPEVGSDAPDFELPYLGDRTKTVRLSSFRGDRPVGLIFGSYT